jgi:general secretion pathway protein K
LSNYQLDSGTVSVTITDLERKVNINTANPQMIQQALTLMGVDADDISTISDSIVDWIDADDTPGLSGAESDYYQSLVPPYYAKNSPIDDLSELLLVKGIRDNPEIYWGGSATNLGVAATGKKLGFINSPFQNAGYPFGLKDIFTPISGGLINVNTAGTNVLQMIPGVDGDTATAIVQQRAGPDGVEGTDDDTPFRGLGDFKGANLDSSVCGVRSYTFEVHVIAQYAGFKREYIAILYRNSGADIQVLNFYWNEPDSQSAAGPSATGQNNSTAN